MAICYVSLVYVFQRDGLDVGLHTKYWPLICVLVDFGVSVGMGVWVCVSSTQPRKFKNKMSIVSKEKRRIIENVLKRRKRKVF